MAPAVQTQVLPFFAIFVDGVYPSHAKEETDYQEQNPESCQDYLVLPVNFGVELVDQNFADKNADENPLEDVQEGELELVYDVKNEHVDEQEHENGVLGQLFEDSMLESVGPDQVESQKAQEDLEDGRPDV